MKVIPNLKRTNQLNSNNLESLQLYNKYQSAMDLKKRLKNAIYQGRKHTYKIFNRYL